MRTGRWMIVAALAVLIVGGTSWFAWRAWTRPLAVVKDRSAGYNDVSGAYAGFVAGEDRNGKPVFLVVRYNPPGSGASLAVVEMRVDGQDPSRTGWFVDGVEQPRSRDFQVFLTTDRVRWAKVDLPPNRAVQLYDRLRGNSGDPELLRIVRDEVLPLAQPGN